MGWCKGDGVQRAKRSASTLWILEKKTTRSRTFVLCEQLSIHSAVSIAGFGEAKSGSDSKRSCGLGSFRKPSVGAEKQERIWIGSIYQSQCWASNFDNIILILKIMMWDVGELREDVFLKFDFEKNRILVNRGYSIGYVQIHTCNINYARDISDSDFAKKSPPDRPPLCLNFNEPRQNPDTIRIK